MDWWPKIYYDVNNGRFLDTKSVYKYASKKNHLERIGLTIPCKYTGRILVDTNDTNLYKKYSQFGLYNWSNDKWFDL
jgi:hypothetical protein